MGSISDLNVLLKCMQPKLHDKEYVFCIVPEERDCELAMYADMFIREEEGVTLILEKEVALREGLAHEDVWSKITLCVNSDLQAVGFLAAMTQRLAQAGVSVNAVSGYHHDHLFVLKEDAGKAMKALFELQEEAALGGKEG